ncbi:hypothetical protein G4B88_008900 [Cannabis sativa]|uniref:PGG domain-containing protein n=1 Tax=Cannabis sativa TaxID=3483 RepID=A0A7J6HP65_CANSA|nr:hypothetical protein G4B88_008900 [Cannabis sativa]
MDNHDQGEAYNTSTNNLNTSTPSNSSSPKISTHTQSSGSQQVIMTIDDWSRRNSLFHATLSGDYTTAKKIIDENPNILKKDFLESKGRKETVLHVAVGAKQAKYFVRQLLRDFEDYIDVSLKDSMGNTAFFSACAAGILDIVDEFLKLKNCRDFITIPGGGDVSPLYIAVSFGHGKVASRLYYQTKSTLCSILILGQSTVEESKALKLVKVVWNRILEAKNYIHSEICKEIQFPFHLLMEATKVGNHDFLVVILSGYPELIWERTHENETIFNFAVKNRHVDIFKLIHEVGLSKQIVQNFEDEISGNNLLHIAALKPPHSRLRSIEVRNIVIPSLRNKMNLSGQTPQDLFTEKHNDLMKDSEKWMKKNANICLLVATIIVTIIFQANSDISSSGDENTNCDISRDQNTNSSNIESSIVKNILLISNTIAMSSSSIAVMLNLFIIISRFSEDELFRPLPIAFIVGIISLYISITFMMTSFCLTSFIGTKSLAIRIFTCFLELLPVILFPYLVYPIFIDLINMTFFSKSKFKPGKRVLGRSL